MNVTAPSRRLLLSLRQRTPSQCQRPVPLYHQRRMKSDGQKDLQRKNRADSANTSESHRNVSAIGSGKLGPSIFDSIPQPLRKEERDQDNDELEVVERGHEAQMYGKDGAAVKPTEPRFTPRSLRPTFKNPQPKDMIRWERKQVIEHVRGRHRLNKNEKLLRTERFHSARSPFVKTSIKKLGPLARQIAGKTVEEAMIQMRFSKKKAAQDVLKHLKYVRDQAVVAKGMGLGKEIGAGIDRPPPNDLEAKLKKEGKVSVEDKEGKRRLITDRSAMYIDQAWVGRGKYDFGTDYRARGQANKLYLPYTSISIVLKEEATRMRLQHEREQKRLRKPVWVPLPDRPITAQRQYPLW